MACTATTQPAGRRLLRPRCRSSLAAPSIDRPAPGATLRSRCASGQSWRWPPRRIPALLTSPYPRAPASTFHPDLSSLPSRRGCPACPRPSDARNLLPASTQACRRHPGKPGAPSRALLPPPCVRQPRASHCPSLPAPTLPALRALPNGCRRNSQARPSSALPVSTGLLRPCSCLIATYLPFATCSPSIPCRSGPPARVGEEKNTWRGDPNLAFWNGLQQLASAPSHTSLWFNLCNSCICASTRVFG